MCVCVLCREIEYLKTETAQRRAQEESEATHKEEADNLQEKVSGTLTLTILVSSDEFCVSVSAVDIEKASALLFSFQSLLFFCICCWPLKSDAYSAS